ncbi:hypothetical protein RFF01_004483, partial [Klebsiella variicola]
IVMKYLDGDCFEGHSHNLFHAITKLSERYASVVGKNKTFCISDFTSMTLLSYMWLIIWAY